MYASGIHNAEIDAYGLIESDYRNYFNEIDLERLSKHEIVYDEKFINESYLPRLAYLTYCLQEGRFPNIEEVESGCK